MFSGIVQAKGRVSQCQRDALEMTLTIIAPTIVTPTLKIGDSVAVNGICLTVTALQSDAFSVAVMPETTRRTNLGQIKVGSEVNLERALQVNGRLDGHIVQGHVDYCGQVQELVADEHALRVLISLPADYQALVVPKGSIAVDGVSLTVVAVTASTFEVDLIPHSQDVTTLSALQVGDAVNVETDILGKYLARQVVLEGSH
ncbi:riboflavin synthase subunit alpha [Lactiplantibacillus plantarum EGD-AQ4]|nr:riboflavin synthase subunit alpha [Lactiplantibacillus plantarum EGD-AQ4]